MKGRAFLHILMLFLVGSIFAQDVLPTSTPTRKRGWLGRLLHPFSPESISQYKDTRLRGLTVDLQITPQSIKLSEVRQLGIKLTLANISKRPVTLDFPTSQPPLPIGSFPTTILIRRGIGFSVTRRRCFSPGRMLRVSSV